MTADLRENCHFGAFHIFSYFSPKWANIYFSSVLWSTGGCFHHFKRLSGELKKLKIFPTPVKDVILGISQTCIFLISNGQIFTFQVSWGQLVVVFISFKDFPESRKNWSFSWPTNCEKIVIFRHFTFSLIFHPNEQILTFQVSYGQLVVVFIILKGFLKSGKKLKIFPTPALREKCHFGHFTNLHISHQNGQIFTFQVSWGQLVVVFISFKDFPESRKNWSFSWPRTCERIVILGHFTFSLISHPNEQIFTFQVSCGQLVVVFIILKGFLESWKNWRFSPPRPCVKNVILGISQTCIFLIQMGKYLPFKCPGVNWW